MSRTCEKGYVLAVYVNSTREKRKLEFMKSIIDSVDRKMARQLGITLTEYRKRLHAETEEHWCSCNPHDDNPLYCANGQRRNEHCYSKHHWHCGRCMKIVQIG